jgi:DNA-binding MarR family transcriptional regulator
MKHRGSEPRREAARLAQGDLAGLIGYRLRRAQQELFRDFAASIPDISPGRAGLLMLIEANPGVTQSRLARAMALDRSTMVGVLDVLESRGWLERRKGSDRRTNGLWLTRAGRVLLARIKRRITDHEARVTARLSSAERQRLLTLLGKLCPE